MIDVNIDDFKNLLSMAGAFTSEVTFVVKGNTLNVMVIDDAHVAMAKGSISLNSTPEVDCFTVDIEKALKALATTGNDVKIYVKDGVILFKGEKSKASLSLYASTGNVLKEPKYEPIAYGSIQPSRLKSTLAFGQFSKADFVKITLVDGKLSITTGVYPNVAEIDGDEIGMGSAIAGFMMEYVQDVTDLASKAKSNLKISLGGDDYPALFEWGNENAKYSVLVAPRIES